MVYRILLVLAAINGAIFGGLFILAPDATISLFGGRLDALGSLLVRQFGGTILGIAIFDWLLRNQDERDVQRAVVVANGAAFAVVSVVAAYGAIAGIANLLAWGVAAFHAVVGIGLVATYLSSGRPARQGTVGV